jgi:predicted RNA-binding protein YlxR (DUF448 family)
MNKDNSVKKKQPTRRCIGCMGHFPKNELIRVVREPEGTIILDMTGKKNGRGAYICKSAQCLKKAEKARRIESALECALPDGIYDRLIEELNGAE